MRNLTLCNGAELPACDRCARHAERPENRPRAEREVTRLRPMLVEGRGCQSWEIAPAVEDPSP